MSWFVGPWEALAATAVKMLLLYLTAVCGLRLARRRMVAELTTFDFVAAVAIGAVVGRTATATGSSFLQGFVALAVLAAVHALVSRLRYLPGAARLIDHPVRVLVEDGKVNLVALRACCLTEPDLYAALRTRGRTSLAGVRQVLYEPSGGLTIVPEGHERDELLPG